MATATSISRLSANTRPRSAGGKNGQFTAEDSRFDKRLGELLDCATGIFFEKGFAGASMRDLSRESGMSLAGLYYYFDSKEKLLYQIQKHTFETIQQRLREHLDGIADPELRVRVFIHNHLGYFLANKKAMKVLSHEDDVLKNGYGAEIRTLKRQYYQTCFGLLEDLKRAQDLKFSPRIAVLSLFGMVNWIYTWHNARSDADADQLACEMGDIFLGGVGSGQKGPTVGAGKRSAQRKRSKRIS